MCRNIKTLFNFDPPATSDEVLASSLQFVRKLSGFTKPSKANEATFELALQRVSAAAQEMLDSLVTNAPPRSREIEAARLKAKSAERFVCRFITKRRKALRNPNGYPNLPRSAAKSNKI